MSTDGQAAHQSLNVKYSRKNRGDEDKESRVEIYENEDVPTRSHADVSHNKVRAVAVKAVRRNRCKHAASATTLGALYVLILAGIYLRYILATLDKEELERAHKELVRERDRLNISLLEAQMTNIVITKERDRLNTSLHEAHLINKKITKEREEILRICDHAMPILRGVWNPIR